MELPQDWSEFLSLLVGQKVRFLLIGGHAMAAHGAPRFTGDLDVWVQPGKRNAERVMKALVAFGFGSVKGLSDADFTSPGTVVALGHPPMRIDLLTSVSGVTFERAWRRRRAAILGGVPLSVIGVEDLIANKRAAARPKDLVDVATLEALSATRRRG
ncbi:MAG: nucleotidyltransferase [Myxococcales bacterium]|nr:nucleotidyltransferase [Myxococcales bacterium]